MAKWKQARFDTFDGLSLFYHYKEPQRDTKDTLLLLHRGHEHSARMTSIGDDIAEDDYWCFSFDLRGHGESEGVRAWAPDFSSWVKDLNSFGIHIRQQFDIQINNMLVVANSVSSTMVLSWVMNYGANIKGCVLAAPAFSIRLYIPLALPALRLLSKFTTNKFVTSYVRPKLLTRDEKAAEIYANDELITKKIGVNVLVGLFEESKRCFNRLADFETPVLLLSATDDYIVHNKHHYQFMDGISSTKKQHIILEKFRHAIFFEKEKHKFIKPVQAFISEQFSHSMKQLPAIIPAAREHTQKEYTELLNETTPANQYFYKVFRDLMSRYGKWSDGVQLGLNRGFDSGVMLDYVYRNETSGKNIFGKIIDRIFLNSVGWKGIRIRKQQLKQTLEQLIKTQFKADIKPVILDVASGVGRYLFELQTEAKIKGDRHIDLHLNDIDEHCITAAKALQTEFDTKNVTFTQHDIFALESKQTMESSEDNETNFEEKLDDKANIIVISGLFELYENNQQVHHVLSHLYSLLQEGGYLVYTGQPWHPQMKLIGRLLNNRHGNRWVMRRRIQTEMDQLVTSVGFNKLDTRSDDLGIFTVSCAQKSRNREK